MAHSLAKEVSVISNDCLCESGAIHSKPTIHAAVRSGSILKYVVATHKHESSAVLSWVIKRMVKVDFNFQSFLVVTRTCHDEEKDMVNA